MNAKKSATSTATVLSYRMILWDFDGTLADTLASGVDVYNEIAGQHGFNQISDPSALRDLGLREVFKRLKVPLWKAPWLTAAFISRQKKSMAGIRLFPGIEDVLLRLRASGFSLGIVSSNSEDSIRICLQACQAEHFFDVIVGSSLLFGKHTAIQQTIARHQLQADHVLYVGDEVRDIEAAQRIPIDMASVTWGWHSQSMLAAKNPTFLLAEPHELLTLPRVRSGVDAAQ